MEMDQEYYMNKNIEQVIEIEKQAQAVSEAAVRDAEKIPAQAQEEAQALIEKIKRDAEEEARRIMENVRADEESARILSEAQEKANQTKSLAEKHLDEAVRYVIDTVSGKK